MPSVFTRIIDGELPGRFVWRDDVCVAFLTIAPINPGHTLVVPIQETDRWTDVDPAAWTHCSAVAHTIGRAVETAFDQRVAVLVAGLEVPHCHIHLIPFASEGELRFERARPDTPAADLDAAADAIRAALRDQDAGEGAVVV